MINTDLRWSNRGSPLRLPAAQHMWGLPHGHYNVHAQDPHTTVGINVGDGVVLLCPH